MLFKKIKYLLIFAVTAAIFGGAAALADNGGAEFDAGSVIVITKPQSANISLYSVNSVAESSKGSVFDELGITEITTLMNISENNAGQDGVSLFSFKDTDKQIIKLTLPEAGEDKVLEAVERLNESGAVEYAQPNYYIYLDARPNDAYYNMGSSYRYHLAKVGAQYVWDMGIDCSAVNVAVLDSGLLINHEDIAGNLWTNPLEIPGDGIDNDGNGYIDDIHGWDFSTPTSSNSDPTVITDPYDSSSKTIQGHGTHVSGIISAVTNNGKGVASLARNAKIIPVKIFDDDNRCGTDTLISGLNYIKACNERGNKIPIANCSLGATTFGNLSSNLAVRVAFLSSGETLFTAAAGNTSSNIDTSRVYPASYGFDNIISVAASDSNDKLAYFSNYGSTVEIAAPGVSIFSTKNTNLSTSSYGGMSGTSQAAPLVAGTAAVLKAKYPNLTARQIKDCILNGAEQISTLNYTDEYKNVHTISNNRRLNAYGALEYAADLYCAITWKDEDGSIIDVTSVSKNTVPKHDGVSKDSTAEYDYEFSGWSPAPSKVTGDTVYTAVYNKTKKSYTVKWRNEDGSLLDADVIEYGETPYHAPPEKEDTAEFTYIFTGWTPAVAKVTGNAEYTAVFKSVKRTYTVTWKDEDGSILGEETLEYGEIPYHEPFRKESDGEYDYTFTGWTPSVSAVTGNAGYTAVFTKTAIDAPRTYIDVTDRFADEFKLQKIIAEDGSALLSIIPREDKPQPSEKFTAYLAVYTDGGALDEMKKIDFVGLNAALARQENKNCRLLIWTENLEPVINVITDMAEFWNEPSQK